MRLARAALVLAFFVSCASSPCRPGESAEVVESLYFGTDMPGGRVSAEQWQDFLATVITPRFPEGLTSWAAAGQWRGKSGAVVKEDSYVLQILHAPSDQSETAIREIVAMYRERFQQEAVLRVRSQACISF